MRRQSHWWWSIVVAAVLATGIGTSAQAATFYRMGYIDNPQVTWDWNQYNQLFNGSYTHIMVAFLIPDASGNIVPWDATVGFDATMVKRAHDNGIKVIGSIGGATVPFNTYMSIFRSPTAKQKFISNALSIMNSKGYDGLDLDFEGWYDGLSAQDIADGNGLGQALAQAVKAQNPAKLITVTLAPSYWLNAGFTCAFVNSNMVDIASHMSYDFFWGTQTSANGPYRAPGEGIWIYQAAGSMERSVYGSLQYLISKGCNVAKMTAGLPFYSTHSEAWNSIRNRTNWSSIALDPNYLEKRENAQTPYNFVNDGDAIRAKVAAYKTLGLAGVIVWEVGLEGPTGDLSAALYAASTGAPAPTPTPSPTPSPTPTPAPAPTPPPSPAGFTSTPTISSDWVTGYCEDVTVKNVGGSAGNWTVTLQTNDTVGNLWNGTFTKVSGGIQVVGASWNASLAAGATTSFGFCANRATTPSPTPTPQPTPAPAPAPSPAPAPAPTPPPSTTAITTSQKITDDWGTGYCADVTVKNTSAAPVIWQATVTIDGTVSSLWNGTYTVSGKTITIVGANWNKQLAGLSSTTVGYCAKR